MKKDIYADRFLSLYKAMGMSMIASVTETVTQTFTLGLFLIKPRIVIHTGSLVKCLFLSVGFNLNQATSNLTKAQKKVLILSSLGGVLEFFDFIIYMFLVPYIEKLFFTTGSSFVTTLKTLAVFSAGYLIRPLGGMIFSHFGDRYGRKVVFLLTVLFMAVPSFAIGILPTTAQIGMFAPMLLLILRLMQGLAIGGEIPAAMTFISEHVAKQRLGFAMAVLFFGINIGLLMGSLAAFLLTTYFTEQEILAYAWRIPFILGGFFGIGAIVLRRHLQETAAFKSLTQEEKPAIPLLDLVRGYYPQVLQGVCLVALASVCLFMYLYWPTYLHKYLNYDFSKVTHLNTLGILMLCFAIVLGGLISDRFGHIKVYFTCVIGMLVVAYPIYLLFGTGKMPLVYTSYFLFTLLFGIFPSCYGAILPQMFPTAIRYSGVALSYNLSFALFSGFSPVVCTLLIEWTNNVFAPAWYMMLVACITGLACYYGYARQKKASFCQLSAFQ
ncbi:MFS transporter [Legionella sp. W05-934-2]|uniref:MFS transporter n=1 Tax=Legionella sp. W05-934-2 TaxID=1198649 RepID=UPI003462B655